MVRYLILNKVEYFTWNGIMSTRLICIGRWYDFVNFF